MHARAHAAVSSRTRLRLARAVLHAAVAAAPAAALIHCGSGGSAFPPPPPTMGFGGESTTSGSGGGGLGFDASAPPPPGPDASGLCGNAIYQIITDPPTVYFLLDVSGSMGDLAGVGTTKYEVVQQAAVKVVSSLGNFIQAGAAVFPLHATDADPCAVGGEIFAPAQGQASAFALATSHVAPSGGTPTAATLTALLPHLQSFSGKTILVLATDGGPNCNPAAACDAGQCMDNIQGCIPGETCCALHENCCAPGGQGGPLNCVDVDPTVSAVAAVAAAGIPVYVIGIPGSGPYGDVLTQMAKAGGAATPSAPFYYDVSDLSKLESTLLTIAAGTISCDFMLSPTPTTMDTTAVYFDQTLVPFDAFMKNGWAWSGPSTITLYGSACAALKSGQVTQVQIVSGCPTDAGAT